MIPDIETVVVATLAFIAALSAGFFALFVLAAYFERRLIWPYGEIGDEDRDAPPAMPFHDRQARRAESLGLAWAGAYRDLKGRLYRVRYEFWLAPERDVLAMVGAGTVAGMPVEAIWLYTPLADGRVVVSTNSQSGMDSVPADPWDWALRIDAGLPELIGWHRDRAAGMFARVEPFDAVPARAVGSMARRRAERTAGFVARGIARYRDPEEAAWSFTALGGCRLALGMYARGFRDAVIRPVAGLFSGR